MGRQKLYSEDAVLEKAMISFWKHGYDQLSMRQLELDMGINQFSIYASFQSKDNLFKQVLTKYKSYIEDEFLADLQTQEAGLEEIKQFLLNFSHSIQVGKVPNGCLMVNTAMELSKEKSDHYKIVKSYFGSIEQSFKRVLSSEQLRGNLDKKSDINKTALYLLGIAQSISILSKTQTKEEIENYVSFAMKNIG